MFPVLGKKLGKSSPALEGESSPAPGREVAPLQGERERSSPAPGRDPCSREREVRNSTSQAVGELRSLLSYKLSEMQEKFR